MESVPQIEGEQGKMEHFDDVIELSEIFKS